MTDKILIAGLGRCGTSLMMQMLDKGGYPVHGTFPAYEDAGMEAMLDLNVPAGKAAKVVDFHRVNEIEKSTYRIVFLKRNRTEQAKSMVKFGGMMGLHYTPQHRMAVKNSLIQDEAIAVKKMKDLTDRWMITNFEALISKPTETLTRVSKLIGDFDIEKAATALIPRNYRCHPQLLELELLEKE